jgi:hypothetical protein
MKYLYLLIIYIAAALLPNQARAERTLDSLWPAKFRQGSPPGGGEALIAHVRLHMVLPGETRRKTIHGHCMETNGLAKKYPAFLNGHAVGIPYYEFKDKGDLSLTTNSTFVGGLVTGPSIAKFELLLGQSTLGTASVRPPIGKLTVTFNNGEKRTIIMPDSYVIWDQAARITGLIPEGGGSVLISFWSMNLATGQTTALP